jgi:hypothetical protein
MRLITFRFPRYWEELSEDVPSIESLLRRLAEVESEFESREGGHPSATIERGDGTSVLVGLAGDRWHIEWYGAGGECLVAVGDERAVGLTPFVIPEWTEIENRYLIPRKAAESILGEWFESGTLSTCVDWSQ